jgi:TldD protein
MPETLTPSEPFFTRAGLDRAKTERLVEAALMGAEDGELFLEYRQSESFQFDDGRLKAASFDASQGFGLRAVSGEQTGFAHASELSEAAIKRAADTVRAVRAGYAGRFSLSPKATNRHLYTDANPLAEFPFEKKIALLKEIDAYARGRDQRVRQVSIALSGQWQAVAILRPGGFLVEDVRPLIRLNVSIVAGEGERQEIGTYGAGGRTLYGPWLEPIAWRKHADEALRQALVNLEAEPAPAGEMPVVLGPGWPGVLLHEAIGHGLEGDFNRKKTSVFSGRLGQRVAAKGVSVVDDGTLEARRGSLSIDDEGTPSQCTVLIEDGVLKNYMQDRLNARLMGLEPTGNGRRESFAHSPMPRMTNTYMLAGTAAPQDILGRVQKGIYAVNFGGGQVDITSGKFVFNCTEAYRIEAGRIGRPIKGASLIGQGSEVLQKIEAVGNDLKLDSGIGTCGKNGQGVPVGVGLPTLLIGGLTVGGTQA